MPGYRECAGIILFNDEGKVLMGARADKRGNQWQFPQGGIEKDETPEKAALRELYEETSVKSAELIMGLPYPLTYTFPRKIREILLLKGRDNLGQRMHWFLIHFTGDDSEINLKTECPEFKAYEWVDLPRAVKRVVYFKRNVYRKACKLFEPYMNAYLLRAECLVGNIEDEKKI